MCTSDSIFPYLQSTTLFKGLFKKMSFFNFIPQMLKAIGHIWQRKIYDQEIKPLQ